MYYEAVSQCTRMLKNIGTWLDKAEKHAAAKKFDVNILITERLAPDMKPFIYQVQSACDYVKAAAAWLSGQVPPKHEDNEQTIDDARARIQKTIAFAESVREVQYAGASDRKVSLSWTPGKHLCGKDYLLQMTIPNVYFHVAIADNVSRLIDLGVIGVNFEDRVVKGSGLYSVDRQARRLGAIRKAAEQKCVDFFLNARTDVFFEHGEDAAQAVDEALERAKAYADAGASGFFIPGLTEDALIGQLCEAVTLPVNVMVMDGVPSNERLSKLGVARISYGPIPYIRAMNVLQQEAKKVLS